MFQGDPRISKLMRGVASASLLDTWAGINRIGSSLLVVKLSCGLACRMTTFVGTLRVNGLCEELPWLIMLKMCLDCQLSCSGRSRGMSSMIMWKLSMRLPRVFCLRAVHSRATAGVLHDDYLCI